MAPIPNKDPLPPTESSADQVFPMTHYTGAWTPGWSPTAAPARDNFSGDQIVGVDITEGPESGADSPVLMGMSRKSILTVALGSDPTALGMPLERLRPALS